MQKTISIRIKLFSGIDKEILLKDYDPAEGISMTILKGKRLRSALQTIGINTRSPYFYFRDGQRISTWARLRDGDDIACLKPSGGG